MIFALFKFNSIIFFDPLKKNYYHLKILPNENPWFMRDYFHLSYFFENLLIYFALRLIIFLWQDFSTSYLRIWKINLGSLESYFHLYFFSRILIHYTIFLVHGGIFHLQYFLDIMISLEFYHFTKFLFLNFDIAFLKPKFNSKKFN